MADAATIVQGTAERKTMQLITHSRATSFKRCRRRHWYEYEQALRPDVDGKALRMGSNWHVALDKYKETGSSEYSLASLREAYATCPENIGVLDWKYEQWTLMTLINGYAWRWPKLHVLANEQSFQLSLHNPETNAASRLFYLAGKADGIVKLEDGRLAVLEHKLTSETLDSDSDFWRRLQLDSQISLYVLAARELNYDVSAVLYDGTRKPTIKPTPVPLLDDEDNKIVLDANSQRVFKKDGKPRQTGDTKLGYVLQNRLMTPAEWSKKLTDDIAARPEFYFARIEIARLDSELEECREELWEIQKTIRDAQLKERWYRTVSRDTCCFCPYFGICSAKTELDPASPPEGFHYTPNIHEELETEDVNV